MSSRICFTTPISGRDFALVWGDKRIGPAQPVQATGALWADAADRDSQRFVDFGVRIGRIAG